jgi:hypothetical protein
LVKIYSENGKEEKFDSKTVENDLKAAGLPERLAKEISERLENRVQDGWTTTKVRQETEVELRRLQEDIDRAYKSSSPMGEHTVGEQRTMKEDEYAPTEQPRMETRVECRNVEP